MLRSAKIVLFILLAFGGRVLPGYAAQDPIQELRLPIDFYADGRLKTELFAQQADVREDGAILATGLVLKVFLNDGTLDMIIEAEDAVLDRERQVASSASTVSIRRAGIQVTGEGFDWNGAEQTLRIRDQARVTLPTAMIMSQGVRHGMR